jgi:glycosyltransferase involved in cell wall biosynthesis
MILTVFENSAPLGVTANFEQAVKACSGELIALCDQDDVWHPDRLEKAATLFDADAGLLLAFGDARLIDDEGNDLGRSLFDRLEVSSSERSMVAGGEGFRVLIKRNLATGATVMFRRRLLDQALPFPPEWVHDEWLAIIAASFGGIELMQESLVDYRQHSSNVIGVRAPTFWYKFTRVIEAQGNRNARLAERARALVRRLEEFEGVVEPHDLDLAVGKARAEAFRAALPSSRLLRIVPILRAASRGWYVSFTSQGRKDMVRDLVQPHRDAPQRAAG